MIDNTRNERHEQRRRIQQGKDHDRRVQLEAHLKRGMPLSAADHAFLNGVTVPSPAQVKASQIIGPAARHG